MPSGCSIQIGFFLLNSWYFLYMKHDCGFGVLVFCEIILPLYAKLKEEGRPLSVRTIYFRIRAFDLFSYRPRLVLLLLSERCHRRVNWCRER